MKNITATPDLKTDTAIHVKFLGDDGTAYDRWVDRTAWLADPAAVTAQVFAYMTGAAPPLVTSPSSDAPLTMSAADVAAKLATAAVVVSDATMKPLPVAEVKV